MAERLAQGTSFHGQARSHRENGRPIRSQSARRRVVAAAVDRSQTIVGRPSRPASFRKSASGALALQPPVAYKTLADAIHGGVAEWSNAHAWKACGVCKG